MSLKATLREMMRTHRELLERPGRPDCWLFRELTWEKMAEECGLEVSGTLGPSWLFGIPVHLVESAEEYLRKPVVLRFLEDKKVGLWDEGKAWALEEHKGRFWGGS